MKVISVKFKESGRAYYFDPKELEIKEGEFVIVETDVYKRQARLRFCTCWGSSAEDPEKR